MQIRLKNFKINIYLQLLIIGGFAKPGMSIDVNTRVKIKLQKYDLFEGFIFTI